MSISIEFQKINIEEVTEIEIDILPLKMRDLI